MGGVAAGTQAVGAGIGAYGSYQQGLAQERYYRYAAASDRQSAELALKEGQRESSGIADQGALESQSITRKATETAGAQTAAEAANGISGSGTAADITDDTSRKALLDQMTVRYNADRQSWAARNNAAMKAWQYNREAADAEVAGTAAKQAGKIGAFTSLLGGASQVANTWYRGRQSAPSASTGAS